MRDLQGVRVLELGPWINVCYAGKMLADLGAEVIRIESPDGDDQVRLFGPFPSDEPDPETSGLHLYLNSNKLGVTLRPDTATGRDLFRDLCRRADVLLACSPPGFLSASGLDYPSLQRANDRLVVVVISSLGRSGPYAGYKGNDLISWHGGAIGHIYLGEPDREPLRGVWYQASHWGAFNGAVAAMLALAAREKTGRGQWVDLSEAEALALLFLGVEISDFFLFGSSRVRVGTVGLANQAPRLMNRCKNGWVALQTTAPHQWEGLVRAMGNPEWAQSELFKGTGLERGRYFQEINDLMKDWLDSHTAEEIFRLCQAELVPAAPLNTIETLCHNQHLAARGYFVDIHHPAAGPIRVPGAPFRSSGQDPWRVDSPAPLLGQHNEDVYCGMLGLPREDLADLRRAGVV